MTWYDIQDRNIIIITQPVWELMYPLFMREEVIYGTISKWNKDAI